MPDNPLSSHTDPWDTRFGFFWYNDHEIFHAAQDDLNRQAETFADTGINHVITFSLRISDGLFDDIGLLLPMPCRVWCRPAICMVSGSPSTIPAI
ncbi:MAG: hypothetical protein V1800_00485 [Candidatus Latescibacterota bacterium]